MKKMNKMMEVIANVDRVQYVHYVREDGKFRPCDLVFDDEDLNLSGVELRFYGKDGGVISIDCATKEILFCETWEKGYQKVGAMNAEMASLLRPIYTRLYLDKYAELEKENVLSALPKFSIRDLSNDIFNVQQHTGQGWKAHPHPSTNQKGTHTMKTNEVMAYYQAPIFQHYKNVMEWVLGHARKNGVEVTDEEWKRHADGILKKWAPDSLDCIKATMYAWADYLKKTI